MCRNTLAFPKKDDKKAVCKSCLAEVKYTGGTTNLANHMKHDHGVDPNEKGSNLYIFKYKYTIFLYQ